MKKYISLALVLGMLLTVVGIIPAEAKAYEAYPYIYSDFEDPASIADLSTGQNDSKWEAGGAGGSAGALHITQQNKGTGPMQDHQFKIPDAHFLLEGKFKMSAWVKLDTTKTKLKDQTFGFAFWAPATHPEQGTSTSRWMTGWTVADDRFNSGEWVYVEKIIDSWNGAMNSGWTMDPDAEGTFQFGVRLGNVGAGTFGGAVAEDSPSQTELSWYLDDFIIEPVLDPYEAGSEPEEPEEKDPNVLVDVDFSKQLSDYGGAVSVPAGFGTWNEGAGSDGKPGYASIKKPNSEGNTYAQIQTGFLPLRYNKLYKISFDAKADDDATVGSYMKVIADRASTIDPNDPYYKYQFIKTPVKLTKDWQHHEVYMTRQVKAFVEKDTAFLFRCCNDAFKDLGATDNGRQAASFSVDNLKVETFDAPANGDFEWLKGDIPTTEEDKDGDNPNDSKKYGTFYSWFQSGAAVEASSDVPAESVGKRSAKITVNEANGGVNQGVYIANNTENEISFWAKGEGASVGKNIQVKLDRAVEKKDATDLYDVPDTELLGTDLKLTDTWTKYTIPYSPKFTTTGTDNTLGPRQPFMSFVVDGGASGLTYYLDDVAIRKKAATEPEPTGYPLPYATNLTLESTNVVNGTATFSYEFQTEIEDVYEGKSVVRVIKELEDGKSVTLAQLTGSTNVFEYVIPEAAIGGTLRFEIMPFTEGSETSAPVAGAVYKIKADDMVKTAFTITPTLGKFDAASGSITGSLFVENNKADDSDMNMFLAIILYDEDNGVVRFDSKPISVTKGNSDTITLSVTTADDPELKPIVKAKAFVWGGTGIFDTDMVSYADVIEVTK